MPKIQTIRKYKSKVKVHFDNDEILEINLDVYPNFYLYVGKEVSKKELEAIKRANDGIEYLNYALTLRQKALYTEYKMREKLYDKGASKPVVDHIIKRMKEMDLIDDEAFIEDHIEYYNSLNYGKNKIKTKLKEKGIFEDRIEKIRFPISIERKKAHNLLNKLEKKYEKYNFVQKKQHIYQAYLSLGFESDIALEMLEYIKDTNPKEENKKLEKDFDKIYLKYKNKYSKKEIRTKLISYLASKGYKINDIINMMERKGI